MLSIFLGIGEVIVIIVRELMCTWILEFDAFPRGEQSRAFRRLGYMGHVSSRMDLQIESEDVSNTKGSMKLGLLEA